MERIYLQLILTLALATIPPVLEHLQARSSTVVWRAVFDNIAHIVIGVLSWIIIEPYVEVPGSWNLKFSGFTPSLKRLIVVALVASLIDLDHFFVARSWKLDHAVQAPYRGLLHSSGLFVLLNTVIFCLDFNWGLMLLVGWFPHHLRDSTRRGFYVFPPSSSTSPIPASFAAIITLGFPWMLYHLKVSLHTTRMPATSKTFVV